jgi:hypothetical protein
VNHDADVIAIIKRRSAAIERGVIELPFRRSELPDELLFAVFLIAGPTPPRSVAK